MATISAKTKITHKSGGLRSTIRRMEERGPLLENNVATSIYKGVRHRCPVRTGYMKSTIQQHGSLVFVGAFYGVYVNYGTRYQHANPFFSESVAIDGLLMMRRQLSILMSPGIAP